MRRPAHFGRIALRLTGLTAVLAASAHAQIKHNDYTLSNSPFSTDKASTVFISAGDMTGENSPNYSSRWTGKLPEINDSMTSKDIKMATLDTKFSAVNGQMDNETIWQKIFNKGDNKPLKMFTEPDTRRPTMVTQLQKDSPLNRFTAYDEWQRPNGVSKYDNAFTFHTAAPTNPLDTIGQELSMQDINRYEFHSSNSNEPGLPTTHAAGDSTAAHFDSGQLTATPRLFDFVGGQTTTHVRSGGAVAPRIITADGSRSYVPVKQGGGMIPTSLTGPGSSASSSSNSPGGGASTSSPSSSEPNLQPSGIYAPPRDGVNTPVEYGPYQIWVNKNYQD